MNSSAENTTPDQPERPAARSVIFNLTIARRMLALVRPIVADVLGDSRQLGRLELEQEDLDRRRHTLEWAGRSRRYTVREEMARVQRHLDDAVTELGTLGVVLLDAKAGRVGFLTLVNGHRAYFSWQPGEDAVATWHFADEEVRRPIPPSWTHATELRLIGNVR